MQVATLQKEIEQLPEDQQDQLAAFLTALPMHRTGLDREILGRLDDPDPARRKPWQEVKAGLHSRMVVNRESTLEADEIREFREQCRRQMARPIESRMKYGFCRVNRQGLDRPGTRVFRSTADYREWCARNLPAYLGYQPAPEE